jgi:hypothetical protein
MKTVVLRVSSLGLAAFLSCMFFAELASADQSDYNDCIAGAVPFDTPGTPESCAWTLELFQPISESNDDAQTVPGGDDSQTPNPGDDSEADNPTPNSTSEGDISISFKNPLKGIDSPEDLLNALVKAVVIIAAPIIVLFIILSGFKYVTAQGDPTKLTEAKRALIYSIIGAVIIIGSAAILEIVANTINAFKN